MSFSSALRNRAFQAMNSSLEMEKQGRRDIAHNKITLAIKSDPSVPLFHVIRGEKEDGAVTTWIKKKRRTHLLIDKTDIKNNFNYF